MNEELILKKRSEGFQSLIKAEDLQELASLSEIIATEVIKYKPGTDCYTFIYQLLLAMKKSQEAMEGCVNENKTGQVPSPCGVQPSNLKYYMKESMDNYFRSGLKKSLSAIPGCPGCNNPLHDEVASVAGARYQADDSSCRRNTDGATQTTAAAIYQHQPWDKRQTWHTLLHPESLGIKHKNAESQVSKEEDCSVTIQAHEDELNSSDDPSMAVVCAETLPHEPKEEEIPLEMLNDDPKAPTTTPRSDCC